MTGVQTCALPIFVYNYLEDLWSYGSMGRTAWLDSGALMYPLASTYANNLVWHEYGLDDGITSNLQPINAWVESSEFDIDDGENFAFVRRLLPDITFRNSTSANPSVTMTVYPLANSGSGYSNPASVGGNSSQPVTRTAVVPVEQFTGEIYIRVRGRQLALRVESNQLGTTWEYGGTRLAYQLDGKKN